MTPTEKYIQKLTDLKSGDLGILRGHAHRGLDEAVEGFDLFAGIWWPLRQKNQSAPRREVAWLIAKLYASFSCLQPPGKPLALQLGRYRPNKDPAGKRYQQKFDRMLSLPVSKIEPELRWALGRISENSRALDWVGLTNDLAFWEHETKRIEWAEQFLQTNERRKSC